MERAVLLVILGLVIVTGDSNRVPVVYLMDAYAGIRLEWVGGLLQDR
jgi:hypothetical protein